MSKNNLIACVKHDGRYYVTYVASADTPSDFADYNTFLLSLITPDSKSTRDWGKALVIAHKLQKTLNTEYGVVDYEI